MKMTDDVIIIGIDSGYGNIKTANCCFPASVSAYDKEPVFKENLLVYAKDVKCPICGTVNRSLDLDETDGWMECESCYNAIQILEYAKSKRVPVYQMADCNLLVPLSKKR